MSTKTGSSFGRAVLGALIGLLGAGGIAALYLVPQYAPHWFFRGVELPVVVMQALCVFVFFFGVKIWIGAFDSNDPLRFWKWTFLLCGAGAGVLYVSVPSNLLVPATPVAMAYATALGLCMIFGVISAIAWMSVFNALADAKRVADAAEYTAPAETSEEAAFRQGRMAGYQEGFAAGMWFGDSP